ncbi:Type IV secretory pathway, VirD2 components (relaxase) [Jannaschia faecimaris]|uniref:Type IV secretory pathway, VirD2 components (Relaxase) n=1 Tax=Jannaschia faecimaris TaxID=1244108 RepID=A0A1H3T4P1_9RHOB|nr:Type IV secretory pathway, VirD2 components (relaxase) [Jannaschia faecimaris]
MTRDEIEFHIRPGKPRDHQPRLPRVRRKPQGFLAEVHQAVRRAGGDPNKLAGTEKASGRFNARGRGAKVVAELKGRNPWSRGPDGSRTRARRVTVKARIVKLNPQRGAARGRSFVSAKAIDAHLRYLERDGVTRDSERGQVYSATEDAADGRDFLDRGRDDRHQFRFIVSAEDGVDLSDLRQTTRDLMAQMEADLQTRLDWIAVDHYNTGHPHSHILVRGVTDQGKILNIAGDHIAHGIRERASEIVTLELGRQTELEVTDQLRREVQADRFTRLDRMLIAEQEAANEFADLRPDHDTLATMMRNRALLIARARRLEKMGMATEVRPGEWHISDRAEGTLRALGEREDIIKSMHRALEGNNLNDARGIAQLAVHRDKLRERITGRVLARDLAGDGNGDRVQLVIDGADGRAHQIELPAERCDGISCGMIVAAVPPRTEPRAADRNILAATGSDGTYHPSRHIGIAREEKIIPDPDRFVAAHVRRLEALRRAGVVERWIEDHWKVPQDLPERSLAHDRKSHGSGARMELLSPIGLDKQVAHDVATWLDKELMKQGAPNLREAGFGLEMKLAMGSRKQVLVQRGDAQDLGEGRARAPRDLLQRLEAREIDRVGRTMATDRGRD